MEYKLTEDKIEFGSKILHRIQAVKDFGNVISGDLGGYIESESSLSHDDDCWVYDNDCVSGNVQVSGYAWV